MKRKKNHGMGAHALTPAGFPRRLCRRHGLSSERRWPLGRSPVSPYLPLKMRFLTNIRLIAKFPLIRKTISTHLPFTSLPNPSHPATRLYAILWLRPAILTIPCLHAFKRKQNSEELFKLTVSNSHAPHVKTTLKPLALFHHLFSFTTAKHIASSFVTHFLLVNPHILQRHLIQTKCYQ